MAEHNRMPLEEAQRRVRILSKTLVGFISREFEDGMHEMAARTKHGGYWSLADPQDWDREHYNSLKAPSWYESGFLYVPRVGGEFSDEEIEIAEEILRGE